MYKPIIGVTPLYDTERDSIWMLPGYLDGITAAGGIPLLMPLAPKQEDIPRLAQLCDGFLFTGGHDVNPTVYHEETLNCCGEVSLQRDMLEVGLLKAAITDDKPILGICRGLQFLNAVLGGDLYQDIPSQFQTGTPLAHRQNSRYDIPVHSVDIVPGTPLATITGKTRIMVNSIHHQAIKHLSELLLPAARSTDGLIEAAYHPGHRFILGVQWHPEYRWKEDSDSLALFTALVRQSQEYHIQKEQ